MKVVQILPALESGGVERGTIELSRFLAASGHETMVISAGGRQATRIVEDGGRHVAWPIGKKRLGTLKYVWRLRRFLEEERPHILHLRSRIPAWIAWWAWSRLDRRTRPRLVTTVHGFYRVGRYSSIMTRGERVIAVSQGIEDYILQNYPSVDPAAIRLIHRGIDPLEFPRGYVPPVEWLEKWQRESVRWAGRQLLVLPGRITRLKGHADFLEMLAVLKRSGLPIHGLVAGEADPRKRAYLAELQARCHALGLDDTVSFIGHRADLREIMAVSSLVFSLSTVPESFGRTTVEALSMGKPVIGYDHGGVREQLAALLPEGAVPVGAWKEAATRAEAWLQTPPQPNPNTQFLLSQTLHSTLQAYQEVVA